MNLLKKIKVKDIYLILVIVLGLITISLYSTYALFTSEKLITNNAVNISVGVNYTFSINEVLIIDVPSNSGKEVGLNIQNNSDKDINYTLYYEILSGSSSFLEAGYLEETPNPVSGTLSLSETKSIIVGFNNNSSNEVSIKIGISQTGELTSNQKTFDQVITINTEPPVGKLDPSGANAPDLADGMIPIYYDEQASTWKKAPSDNLNTTWYNYEEKKWANAVLVTESSRANYMSASVGTEVIESDILAYLVWIPRYKYQLFNVDSTTMSPIEIPVTFESSDTVSSNGSTDGDWLTHPAFTFDSKPLNGLWVGKFETTGDTTTPTIKPGVISLREIDVATMYQASLDMKSTTYLTTDGVLQADIHMMKNLEWGVVAYLKQSKYGLGLTDIGVNYNSSYYTGGGEGSSYINNSNQSTTGNITGVYDMSGGANEYVMGNYDNNKAQTGFKKMDTIPSKYIDIYTATDYVSGRKLGDATGETRGWYGDALFFLTKQFPWFLRGGSYVNGAGAGVFYAYYNVGGAYPYYSFRVVLAPLAE